jgi:hypothetical protein
MIDLFCNSYQVYHAWKLHYLRKILENFYLLQFLLHWHQRFVSCKCIFFVNLKQYLMKTFFHLGMIALLSISVSSCSKSGSDLVSPVQGSSLPVTTAQRSTLPGTTAQSSTLPGTTKITTSKIRGHFGSHNPNDFIYGALQIYPAIVQPYPEPLGNLGSYLHPGDQAVFFVVITLDYANQNMTNPFLNVIDDATGQVLNTYQLFNYAASPTMAVLLPDALADQYVMYAIVNIDNSFANAASTLSLHAEATLPSGTAVADLGQAFSIIP